MTLELWADFNTIDGDVVWTSIRETERFIPAGHPDVGEWVELWDHDGDRCLGVVTKVELPIIWVKLAMNTWLDSGLGDRDMERSFSEPPPTSWGRHPSPPRPIVEPV